MNKNEFSPSLTSLITVIALCCGGLSAALYLTWLHYQVHTNPSFHSFCAMNDSLNCETVAESPYSVFLYIPVAVWGLIAYLFMLAVAYFGIVKKKLPEAYLALLLLTAVSVLISIVLAVVSHCIICSFCIMCMVTYAINAVLFALLLWQAVVHKFPFREAAAGLLQVVVRQRVYLGLLGIVPLSLIVSFPRYWEHAGTQVEEKHSGVSVAGFHWIGAEKPSLTIVEYSDYLCPHCRRAHLLQRQIVSANLDKLRLVHRQFPLDHACNPLVTRPFHPGACYLARAAICASEEGKFWEMNDLLYDNKNLKGSTWPAKIKDAQKKLKLDSTVFNRCMKSKKSVAALLRDIQDALKLKLRGTPTFIINGKVYLGVVPLEVFAEHDIRLPGSVAK